MATFTAFVGPMGACKSSQLLRVHEKYAVAGASCLVYKHALDTGRTGGDEHIQTHSGATLPAVAVSRLSCAQVNDSVAAALKHDSLVVVLVDEAQFFDDVVDFVRTWERQDRLHCFFAGLDSDASREPFLQMARLACLCDDVVRLDACCTRCVRAGKDGRAMFTARAEGRVADRPQVEVGGFDIYSPVCRACFLT